VLGAPTATGGAVLDAITGGDEDIFLVALAYELGAVGCAVPVAATLADPEEGGFAAAAGVEAAIGGFCAFEMDALIRSLGEAVGESVCRRVRLDEVGEGVCAGTRIPDRSRVGVLVIR
jgi:hypothetical protein